MDDIKLFANNEKELETLIQAMRIYSQDIGMEFGAMLIMKSGKQHLTDWMELTNQEKIWTLGGKETYKYLGILETDTIKQEKKIKNNISGEPESLSKQNSLSSLCRAISTVIPDSLPPSFSIVHRFEATAYISTELFYVGSCWSSCFCSSMRMGPQEYVTYEFIPTSTVVSRMFGSSNLDIIRDRW